MAVTSASEEVARTLLRRSIDRGRPDPLQVAISEFFDQPSSATSHFSSSSSSPSSAPQRPNEAIKNNASPFSSPVGHRRDPSGIPQVGDYVERGSGWCDGDEDGGEGRGRIYFRSF